MAGRTVSRGYGAAHKRLRAKLSPIVASGAAVCSKCGEPIKPGEPWDLAHADRTGAHWLGLYSGAQHRACNRATNHQRRQQPAKALAFFNTGT